MYLATLLALASFTSAASLIASLGSSYAYGYGLKVPIGGYLQQSLMQKTGVSWSFDNLAIAGSLLNNITAYQAPKLKGLSPEVIYILSGGNDLNYNTCLGNPGDSICAYPESQATWQNDFETALDAIFANVANPTNVTVYVVTYPVAIGPDTYCGTGNPACPTQSTTEIQQVSVLYNDQVNFTVAALSDWQSKSTNQRYITKLIPMRSHSLGHEVGSPQPWMNGANATSGTWHPNAAGASNVSNYIFQDFTNVS